MLPSFFGWEGIELIKYSTLHVGEMNYCCLLALCFEMQILSQISCRSCKIDKLSELCLVYCGQRKR